MATDVASRGIHVKNIAHVINYDLPEVAENFIHRVGRTGRNGGKGWRPHCSSRNNVPSSFNWSAPSASKWNRRPLRHSVESRRSSTSATAAPIASARSARASRRSTFYPRATRRGSSRRSPQKTAFVDGILKPSAIARQRLPNVDAAASGGRDTPRSHNFYVQLPDVFDRRHKAGVERLSTLMSREHLDDR